MKVTTVRITLTGAALLVTAAVAAPAQAAIPTDHGNSSGVASHSAALSKAEQHRIADYWTADRMRNAKPIEARYGISAKGKPGATSSGKAVEVPTQPELGKVFFTMGGSNYVCSGTSTGSSNGDVVTTAGHCVNEGPGAFVTNFAFVPAYLDGQAPYGKWTANTLLTTDGWAQQGDFDVDTGFAVMNELGGKSLNDVVGSYPIAFNLARGLTYDAYGYPAAQRYDGQELWKCTGSVRDDTWGTSTDQALPCTMTGGSSGGGWITGGKLNSINSFGYQGLKDTMFGPYFGSAIQAVYSQASTR
jgi:hypothetical protein